VNEMKIDYKAVRWSRINLFRVVVNQMVREIKRGCNGKQGSKTKGSKNSVRGFKEVRQTNASTFLEREKDETQGEEDVDGGSEKGGRGRICLGGGLFQAWICGLEKQH
jgi:hypothetical protein